MKPGTLPACLFVPAAVAADTRRGTSSFENCLGAAAAPQPGRVVLVDVDAEVRQVGFE